MSTQTTRVLVGSTSQRKIEVAAKVFQAYFPDHKIIVNGFDVQSHVPETPYDKQTYEGALNRAVACQKFDQADYYLGLESGLVNRYGQLFEEAWAVIISSDNREFSGYSSGLKVPDFVLNRMKEFHKEHMDVMTIIEEELGKLPNDTWGTYTGGKIARTVSLEESLRNALIQALDHEGNLFQK